MLQDSNGYFWVFICPYLSPGILMGRNESLLVLMRPYETLWIFIDPYKPLCVLMSRLGSLMVLMPPYVSLWVLKGPYVFL